MLNILFARTKMLSIFPFQTTEDSKQAKKNDQPPQAKKPKVKTKTVELPVEHKLLGQLSDDVLNMSVENEVMSQQSPPVSSMHSQYPSTLRAAAS